MVSVADLFAEGVQCHRAGNLQRAEQLYRQVLQTDLQHADAYHMLGVLAFQIGHYDHAISAIRQAISLNPRAASYHSNLGLAQDTAGQLEEAVASYQEALRLQPQFAEAHSNLGKALNRLGRLDEAVGHLQEALRLRPSFPEAHNTLGNVLVGLERLDQAAASFRQAVRLNPHFTMAYNNLGNVLERQNQFDEAIGCFQQALRLDPGCAEALNNLGNVLKKQDKLELAIQSYQQAVLLKPLYAEAYCNLGNARVQQGRFDDAQTAFDQALRCNPHHRDTHANQALFRMHQGRYDDAQTAFDAALESDPSHRDTHVNQALLWLMLGKWAEGWAEHEWRRQIQGIRISQPRWDGKPSSLAGRTVLLLSEQGLGDTLQFVRYVPLVKQRGAKVILQCQASLLPLLSSMPGIDHLSSHESPLPPFDMYVPLMSLPGGFGTRVDSVPATVPYLQADAKLVDHWRRQLAPLGGFKIGIAWQGNPTFGDDRWRSIPLEQFAPLGRLDAVRLISLQKPPGTDQLLNSCQLSTISYQPEQNRQMQVNQGMVAIYNLGSSLDETSGSFMDTAAVVKNLDLVITSDTAVAHLAGALGVPVWVALAAVPDWRWLLQREDSPWYPNMRLFRQSQRGRWEDVFERMGQELWEHAISLDPTAAACRVLPGPP